MPVKEVPKWKILLRVTLAMLPVLLILPIHEYIRSHIRPPHGTAADVGIAAAIMILAIIASGLLMAFLLHQVHPKNWPITCELYSALENSGHILFKFNIPDKRFEYISSNMEQILGFSSAYLNGKSFEELFEDIHPDDRPMLQKFLAQGDESHKGGEMPVSAEYRRKKADGQYCWVAERSSLYFDSSGKLIHMVGSLCDITDRKIDQQKYDDLRNRYKDLFENIGDAIFIADSIGRFVEVNSAACIQLGYDKHEMLGMSVSDIMPPEDRRILTSTINTVLKTGKCDLESLHVRKDGSRIPVELKVSLIDYDGKPAFLGVGRDITARKTTQEQLKLSEERYRQLIEAAHEGVAVIGKNHFLFFNESMSKISGYSMLELVTINPGDVVHPEDRTMVMKYHDDRLAGMPVPSRYEFRLLRKDGQSIWVHISAIRIIWENQPASLVLFLDVTDLINAQDTLQKGHEYLENRVRERTAELARANLELEMEIQERLKMEYVLQDVRRKLLVAREDERRQVAMDLHDSVGQKLIAMNLSVQAIQARQNWPKDNPADRMLSDLAEHCTSLIREIRHISHGLYPPTLESLGLANALAQMIRDSHSPTNITLDCPEDVRRMRLAPRQEIQLFRIAQEALANALKHGKPKNIILGLTKNDDRIVLAISDDGKGFDSNSVRAGMGLNTMRDRAQSCGGTLKINSGSNGSVIEASVPAAMVDL